MVNREVRGCWVF